MLFGTKRQGFCQTPPAPSPISSIRGLLLELRGIPERHYREPLTSTLNEGPESICADLPISSLDDGSVCYRIKAIAAFGQQRAVGWFGVKT